MSSFVDFLLDHRRLPRNPIIDEATRREYGDLRRTVLAFMGTMQKLLPKIEHCLKWLCMLQYAWTVHGGRWTSDPSWSKWKQESYAGYDIVNGVPTDYGNKTYTQFYDFLCLVSPKIHALMTWLSTHYYESLKPSTSRQQSDHAYEMKGDVIEIIMACFRGRELFRRVYETFDEPLPQLFDQLCGCFRTWHLLNAFLDTGRIKYRQFARVRPLQQIVLQVKNVQFVQQWISYPAVAMLGLCDWAAIGM